MDNFKRHLESNTPPLRELWPPPGLSENYNCTIGHWNVNAGSLFFVINILVIIVMIIIYLFASEGFHTQPLERETCTILLTLWLTDWLTEDPATRWMCVKKRKWEEGRQSGCQEGAAPRANAAARPFTQCFFMRSCWFSFPFLWLIYLKGIQTNRTLFFFFVIVVFYLIIRQEERRKKR